jgi:hypothetical protein
MKRIILIAASFSLVLQSQAASFNYVDCLDIDDQNTNKYTYSELNIRKTFINPVLYKAREFP